MAWVMAVRRLNEQRALRKMCQFFSVAAPHSPRARILVYARGGSPRHHDQPTSKRLAITSRPAGAAGLTPAAVLPASRSTFGWSAWFICHPCRT
jgi:hypothetical protein